MTNTAALTPVNLEIYQLNIYRLLTLLLADKTLAKSKQFYSLGERFTEGEVNQLLILTASQSRQLLDNMNVDNKHFGNEICGQYWRDEEQDKPLSFRNACNQIIHAQEVLLYNPVEQKNQRIKYFEKTIFLRGVDIKSAPIETELDISDFAGVCVKIASHSSVG